MILSAIDRALSGETGFSRRSALRAGAALAAGAVTTGSLSARASTGSFNTDLSFGGSFDPMKAEHNTLAFCKLMGDASGEESCGYFRGDVLAYYDGQKALKPLFGFEGFGMTKVIQEEDYGWRKLHREVAYYTDLETGDILETWDNPFTEETVEVLPVYNDPVNSRWFPTYSMGLGDTQVTQEFVFPWEIHGDLAVIDFGVNFAYPSLLDPNEWKRESPGPMTQVLEAIQVHTRLSELMDPSKTKVLNTGSWQRIAPWLPWMLMDQMPGRLFYKTRTAKLNSTADLPAKIRDYTEENYPLYMNAPAEWSEPKRQFF